MREEGYTSVYMLQRGRHILYGKNGIIGSPLDIKNSTWRSAKVQNGIHTNWVSQGLIQHKFNPYPVTV